MTVHGWPDFNTGAQTSRRVAFPGCEFVDFAAADDFGVKSSSLCCFFHVSNVAINVLVRWPLKASLAWQGKRHAEQYFQRKNGFKGSSFFYYKKTR